MGLVDAIYIFRNVKIKRSYIQMDKKVNSVYLSKGYVIIMLMGNLCYITRAELLE